MPRGSQGSCPGRRRGASSSKAASLFRRTPCPVVVAVSLASDPSSARSPVSDGTCPLSPPRLKGPPPPVTKASTGRSRGPEAELAAVRQAGRRKGGVTARAGCPLRNGWPSGGRYAYRYRPAVGDDPCGVSHEPPVDTRSWLALGHERGEAHQAPELDRQVSGRLVDGPPPPYLRSCPAGPEGAAKIVN